MKLGRKAQACALLALICAQVRARSLRVTGAGLL
jgi:hypothetical protein